MEATAKDWLDSLSAGTCEVSALLKGMTELLRRSPEEGWEVLSIVDQYYRRGKISATVFATLKAHLQGLLMGKNRAEVSIPMPRGRSATGAPSGAALAVSATTPVSAEAETVQEAQPAANSAAQAAVVPKASDHVAPGGIAVGSVLRKRYRVMGILGHGGTGTVFEAIDLYRIDAGSGHEKVAIKVLHPNVVRRTPLFAELRREFQRLQLLSHPNIVRVHEFDRDGETAFFTMEHLSGVLLSRVIAVRESAPMSRAHAFAMVHGIADAVGYAHGRGIVHGDVSPGNIFVCNDGEMRVLDFGSNGVATPSFASCQVLEGEPADARDDVYGLACIAYILLTGAHPFQDQTALNARAAKLKLKRPKGLGAAQWEALRAGLSFDRSDRPADVTAWVTALNPRPSAQPLPGLATVMSTPGTRGVSYRVPLLVALVLVILACGAWWGFTHQDSLKLALAGPTPALDAPPSAPPAQSAQTVPSAPIAPAPSVTSAPAPPGPTVQEGPSDARMATPAQRLAPNAPPPAAPPAPATLPSTAVPSTIGAAAGTASAPTSPGTRARLELATDNVQAVIADGVARVMVRRSRSLRGEVNFNWWTESGTAKPGRDFSPVTAHVEQIADGRSAVNLVVPIIADPERHQTRNFYVVIDEADPTAAVGPRTLTMVTIPEPDANP